MRTRRRRLARLWSAVVLPVLVASLLNAPAAVAAPCDPPVVNEIACENTLPGTPQSQWQVVGAGSSTIQGFATPFSSDVGETVTFKVNTAATSYRIDVYRMGYYGGNGARLVEQITPSANLPQTQPSCTFTASLNLTDCSNWSPSATWPIPAGAVSGIYFANLVRTDGTSGVGQLFFVVRDDANASDLVFQTSDTTWQAYNRYGGNSLYFPAADRAYAVSYERPLTTRNYAPQDSPFNAEYPMVRWVERNGYDVTYVAGVDVARFGSSLLTSHDVFLSVGHDEYWSQEQFSAVEQARNSGVDLGFFSGNEVFWKTRWLAASGNPSDCNGTPSYTVMVSYKETRVDAKIDPCAQIWTGTWADPRWSPLAGGTADGGRPQSALTASLFKVNGGATTSLEVPAADGALRFWRNTSPAGLPPGGTWSSPVGVVGYEWDADPDVTQLSSYFYGTPAAFASRLVRPPGTFGVSDTTRSGVPILDNWGSLFGSGTARHRASMYRYCGVAPSTPCTTGALVFGAGTVQWSWGLDAVHDRASAPASRDLQQATVNVLADMGVQPATLQSDLVAATASTDHTVPTASVTGMNPPSAITGTPVTIEGTATDGGGGLVAGIEVTTDGGQTWYPAVGRSNWTYTWTPQSPGNADIRVRAVDDSANLGSWSASTLTTVAARTCPCSIWPDSAAPGNGSASDTQSIEVGVRFSPLQSGSLTAIRFYKGPSNPGPHTVSLWTAGGTLLGRTVSQNETSTGWQTVQLSQPVAVTANDVYVASYHADQGGYAQTAWYFARDGVRSWPLLAPPDWYKVNVPNRQGLFRYSGSPAFPNQSSKSNNYWVDVLFDGGAADVTPPSLIGRDPAHNATGVSIASNIVATFDEPINPATASVALTAAGQPVPGTTSVSGADVTFQPQAPLATTTTYEVSVTAQDLAGNTTVTPPQDWQFTTGGGTGCPCSIWSGSGFSGTALVSSTTATEVGVKFRAAVNGEITGIRFYKGGSANGGTHVGHLWTTGGTMLGEVVFSGETDSGWQTATFATPIPIQAGVTYIASYHAPLGRYAKDAYYFKNKGVTNGPLEALQSGVDGGNGVYTKGPSPSFPTTMQKKSNYWVDVVFVPS